MAGYTANTYLYGPFAIKITPIGYLYHILTFHWSKELQIAPVSEIEMSSAYANGTSCYGPVTEERCYRIRIGGGNERLLDSR